MTKIVPVDVARFSFDLHRDLSVSLRARKPGPPERIDGATIGFVSVTGMRRTAERFTRPATRSCMSSQESCAS
jgi:hypothetical protein